MNKGGLIILTLVKLFLERGQRLPAKGYLEVDSIRIINPPLSILSIRLIFPNLGTLIN